MMINLQAGAPKIASSCQISGFMVDITVFTGFIWLYKPTYIWGAPSCTINIQSLHLSYHLLVKSEIGIGPELPQNKIRSDGSTCNNPDKWGHKQPWDKHLKLPKNIQTTNNRDSELEDHLRVRNISRSD